MEYISQIKNNTLRLRRIKFVPMTEETLTRIKKKREEKELSQENMADELKISQSTYAKIELGLIKLGVQRLQAIAAILGTNVNYFLTQEGSEKLSDDLADDPDLDDPLLYFEGKKQEPDNKLYENREAKISQAMEQRIKYLTQQNILLTELLIEEREKNSNTTPGKKEK